MARHAQGRFDVRLTPLPGYDTADDSPLGRRAIDKVFHGDLDATSIGEMLSAVSATPGSAVYVAVERVSGTLHGRRGSFVLHHTGIMAHGAQQLTIAVAPDSGADDLVGLAGTMTIDIRDGVHYYELAYTLGDDA